MTSEKRMTSEKTWKHVDAYLGWYSFLLSFSLVLAMWLLRYFTHNPVLFGGDAYVLLARLAPYFPHISEVAIRIGILVFSMVMMLVCSLSLGAFSSEHIKSMWMRRIVMGFMAITPAFLYGSASFAISLLTFTLVLLGLITFYKKWYVPLSILMMGLGFVSPFVVLAVVMFIAMYMERSRYIFLIIISSVIGTVGRVEFSIALLKGSIGFPAFISDFGASQGISVVVVILAMLSVLFWDKEWSIRSFLMLGTLALILLFDNSVLLLFHLGIIVLAARTLEDIFSQGWALPTVKRMSVNIVLLSVIFSTIVYIDRVSIFSPTEQEHTALASIRAFTPRSVRVFSEPEQAPFIQYYAQRTPVVARDENDEYYHTVVRSAYNKELVPLLVSRSADAVYVSSAMRMSLPPGERLMFLLSSERFKSVYEDNKTGVWLFTSSEK